MNICSECKKPLPRSRRARKPYPSIIDWGTIFKRRTLEVHSIRCHKKVLAGNSHVIYLWKVALEVQAKLTGGGLKWMTEGDDPLIVVDKGSMVGKPLVYWSEINDPEKFE